MANSTTQTCIRQVSTILARALKPDGFRRHAPHLWRERSDLTNVVHFQASRWGSAESGSFTINLASTNRRLYSTWTGRAFPTNPGTATWPLQTRIGALAGGGDLWWNVDESTDANALAELIVDSFRPGILEWFDTIPSLAALDSRLSMGQRSGDVPGVHEANGSLVRAIIKHQSGDLAGARQCLESASTASRGTRFAETVSIIAARLDFEIT